MIPDMLNNKRLNTIVTELFIRGRKLNISLLFITQSYFVVPQNISLNCTHYIMKNANKQEHQHFLKNFYRNCAAKPYSSLIIDATLASDNLLCFRKNLAERI